MSRRITFLLAVSALAAVAVIRRRAPGPALSDHELTALKRLDEAIAYAESQHPSTRLGGPHGPGCTCGPANSDGVSVAAAYDQVVAARAEIDRHLEAGRRVFVPMPFLSDDQCSVKIKLIQMTRHPERN